MFTLLPKDMSAEGAETASFRGPAVRLPAARCFAKALFLIFTTVLVAAIFSPVPLLAQQPLRIGEPTPAFTLSGLDGKPVTIPLAKKGPAVIVHFWTGTCRSCLREMPIIETLYQQYKGQDVLVYAVNIGESESNVKAFAKKLKITFPILLDTDTKVSNQFGVSGIPRTFFIDRKGMLKKKLLGEAPQRIFDQLIREIL